MIIMKMKKINNKVYYYKIKQKVIKNQDLQT